MGRLISIYIVGKDVESKEHVLEKGPESGKNRVSKSKEEIFQKKAKGKLGQFLKSLRVSMKD